jgi:nucleoside transporter
MSSKTRIQLMIMMFLEFFVWGCWYATMGTYLGKIGFGGLDIGAAFSTISWGAIISPFFIGMIADRFFPAQRVMAAMHLIGAVVLWYLSSITDPNTFFWMLLLYTALYMPTISLSNTISFNQMKNPEKEFPVVRVLGTIGWIVAGLMLGFMKLEDSHLQFQIAAGMSVVLGVYSLFLPHTPPKDKGKTPTISDILGLDALALLKEKSFAVFIFCSFLISIPLSFYYAFTNPFLNEIGMENAAGKMTLGQMSEIVFMLLLPLFFSKLGVKKMLLLGLAAWVLRYILFAYGNNEELVFMLYGGIILHGICYDFFFVTGQIYVDNAAPKEVQASAQGFITLITYGLGMLIGSLASGYFVEQYTLADGSHLWKTIWLIPAAMALGAGVLFAIFFKEKDIKTLDV